MTDQIATDQSATDQFATEQMATDQLTTEQIVDELVERGVRRVKLGITDIDGGLRGRYLTMDRFRELAMESAGFHADILAADLNAERPEHARVPGWDTGFADLRYRLALDTIRGLPFEDNVPLFLAELVPPAGQKYHPLCPRNALRRVLAQGHEMGFSATVGFTYEFTLFDENPHSVRDKGYRGLKPFTPGNAGFSLLRNSVHSDLHEDLLDFCEAMELPLNGCHTAAGAGAIAAALTATDALEAADRASLFKTFAKVFLQRQGLLATFMARWSAQQPGQGGHLQIALSDRESGQSAFHDPRGRGHMSAVHKHFVAGQLKYMRELCALVAPTVNSYSRLNAGGLAPTAANWGIDNRTCALRVIPGSNQSQRVEYRLAGADGNPYLVSAAALASGLAGIREELELIEPVAGDAHQRDRDPPGERQLPATLREAAAALRTSDLAKAALGEEFVEHFAATREWESRQFERMITTWELSRYFEVI